MSRTFPTRAPPRACFPSRTRHGITRFSALLSELKSRHVSRVAITYVAIAFAGLKGADLVLSPLGAAGAYRWILLATLIGFPIALLIAWFFDVRRPPPVVTQPAESTRVPLERNRSVLCCISICTRTRGRG